MALGVFFKEREAISIGPDIVIVLTRASGSCAWVSVHAPQELRIDRDAAMPEQAKRVRDGVLANIGRRDGRQSDPTSNAAGQLRKALEAGVLKEVEDEAHTVLAHLESLAGQHKIAG